MKTQPDQREPRSPQTFDPHHEKCLWEMLTLSSRLNGMVMGLLMEYGRRRMTEAEMFPPAPSPPPTSTVDPKREELKWGCRKAFTHTFMRPDFCIRSPGGSKLTRLPDGQLGWRLVSNLFWKHGEDDKALSALNACTSPPPDYVQPQEPKP